MLGYFVFLFIGGLLLILGNLTRVKGFNKLNIERKISKKKVNIDEEFDITTVIENKKLLPISYLNVKQFIPRNIYLDNNKVVENDNKESVYTSEFSIKGYERIKKVTTAKGKKRGVYLMGAVEISIGDAFGFSFENKKINDFKEIVVYPRIKSIDNFVLRCNGLQGENIVKRWMFEDPIYIKGVRDYRSGDRMKDIHWKASSRMNKLMVKEYDYTSNTKFAIILNVQCGEPYWQHINTDVIENSIELTVALAANSINEGIETGVYTNAITTNAYKTSKAEVEPSINAFRGILELCARMGYDANKNFSDYLKIKAKQFSKNCTYIIVTPFLNKECCDLILSFRNAGYSIKVIDVSLAGDVPAIKGVEKVSFKGVRE